MKPARRLAALTFLLASLAVPTAHADDNVLLIQTGPEGFKVWHTEGVSRLTDDEVLEIMASATPEGGATQTTPLGGARAYERDAGIEIRLLDAAQDKALLVDRDACGHVKIWHAEGPTQLNETELFDIVQSALPEGGKRLRLGDRYVKAFVGKLGVTATLWKVPVKSP
jgi:hypothetical protein